MKHVAAFQPRLETTGPSPQEWDRLPWLRDEPRRGRKRRYRRLAIVVLAVSADAIASYAAGRTALPPAVTVREPNSSAEDMRGLAQRMASAASISWERQRPVTPY